MSAAVLEVRDLTVSLADRPITHAVSFTLRAGRTLALVGESGCGKSVTALSMLNLLSPPLKLSRGEIRFRRGEDWEDFAALPPTGAQIRSIRGRDIAMIFQDPMTALDPVFTVGDQIAEGLREHLGLSRSEARSRALDLLRQVGIPDPARRLDEYPFQMSGGMRQRVMIALAIACSPKVLVADEPTTALDVTVQAQILELMRDLGVELGMATLLITHDLGVVAENADEVVVMYRGHVVERAGVEALFDAPAHPYTRGLLASLPPEEGRGGLTPIPGQVPSLHVDIPGCPFADRCGSPMPICRERMPASLRIGPAHEVACWLHDEPEDAV